MEWKRLHAHILNYTCEIQTNDPYKWEQNMLKLNNLTNSHYIETDCGCSHFRSCLLYSPYFIPKLRTFYRNDGIILELRNTSKFKIENHHILNYAVSQKSTPWSINDRYYIIFQNESDHLRKIIQTMRRQRKNIYSR